jgi:hypothetical protein
MYAILPVEIDMSAVRLLALVRDKFQSDPSSHVTLAPPNQELPACVSVNWAQWSLRLHYETAAHVRRENMEIAETYASGRADKGVIAESGRRITLASDDDPNMEHFNDFCSVLEVLTILSGVILFDDQAEKFMELGL